MTSKQSVVVSGPDGEPILVPVGKLTSPSQRGTLLQAVAERGKVWAAPPAWKPLPARSGSLPGKERAPAN